EHTANLKDVLGAFNRKEQFIQLSDHTVGLLPIGEIQQTLEDLNEEIEIIGQEVRIKKSKFGALESLWETSNLSPALTELKHQWKDFKGIQTIPPSHTFHGYLRPYQQSGLNWLMFLNQYGFHGILADEMGLGKTVQILAFLSCLPLGKPHLILLPTSLVFNWRNEIHRFLPSFKVIVHQGVTRTQHQEELEKADIILTSYTILRVDLSLFKKMEFNCLILDEAQVIKNASTLTSQAVCQLIAQTRISMTGTPVENHLLELWSHFRFLIPDLLGSQQQFQAELLAAQSDRRYLERIKKKVNPFFLRRKKIDVAKDLPPRIDQVVWIEMGEEQRYLYDKMLVQFKTGLLKKVESDGIKAHRMEILEALLRLRQVCCHPLLVSQLSENPVNNSAKFDALFEDLETVIEEGYKVLVYSQFTSMLKLMAKESKARGWDFGYLDGSTTNREEEVNQFQNNPNRLIFFISLKAGGVGLNLTAADYVYLYDPWWNEAVEEQAINRAHRIGREDRVIAKRFIITESVEEKMMQLKAAKRLLAEDLFDSENLSELTLEDLESLFL
ncbi:MAG: DEAD/DEAH box helicase, partial [Parachlamydiaceae bacterium]|nr:DEAD/DEAH box helicase [Parachlamydiaceae bacterium]